MVKIENAPAEYVGGKMTIILEKDDERPELEFALDIKTKDINKLFFLDAKLQLSKNPSERLEKDLDDQFDVVRNILERSYPDQNKDWIEGLMVRYSKDLLLEIKLATKLSDRDAWNAAKKAKELELKKINDAYEEGTRKTEKPSLAGSDKE